MQSRRSNIRFPSAPLRTKEESVNTSPETRIPTSGPLQILPNNDIITQRVHKTPPTNNNSTSATTAYANHAETQNTMALVSGFGWRNRWSGDKNYKGSFI